MFSHKDAKAEAAFVTISLASGNQLQATAGHYVWAARGGAAAKLVRAADFRTGDTMSIAAHHGIATTSVELITVRPGKGLYNPHTASGSIFVDGVLASTFTEVLPPSVAVHTAVTYPAQMLYTVLHFPVLREAVNRLLLSLQFVVPAQAGSILGLSA